MLIIQVTSQTKLVSLGAKNISADHLSSRSVLIDQPHSVIQSYTSKHIELFERKIQVNEMVKKIFLWKYSGLVTPNFFSL